MTDLTMHGYFNDIHIINADRIPNCLIELRSFSYSDRASLELLSSGAMRYIVDRQQFILRAPVVFWNVPGKTYTYKIFRNMPRDQAWVDFAGPRARRIARALERLEPRNFIAINNELEFGAVFDELIRVHTANDPTALFKLAVNVEKLVGMIYESIRCRNITGDDNAVWHRTALEIARQPFLEWDFHRQACDRGMSYSHFRRHFRAVIGMAPHDYLLLCRARQAAQELQTRGISIKQLAYEHGFSDPASLSRLIKNKLGITPSVLIGRHK
ncbi:MAG: helix-turn-helix transcriptional regulator [Kiritimatiellia bacterium]|jgi:AraC-like DNA-binding protein